MWRIIAVIGTRGCVAAFLDRDIPQLFHLHDAFLLSCFIAGCDVQRYHETGRLRGGQGFSQSIRGQYPHGAVTVISSVRLPSYVLFLVVV